MALIDWEYALRKIGDGAVVLLGLLLAATIMTWAGGCASDQARQGTVEIRPVTEMALESTVEAAVVRIEATVTQEADSIRNASQTAVAAFQAIDQSSGDKIATWLSIVFLALLALVALTSGTRKIARGAWRVGRKAVTRHPHPRFHNNG